MSDRSTTTARFALVVSMIALVPASYAAYSAYEARDIAGRALDNASPNVTVETEIGPYRDGGLDRVDSDRVSLSDLQNERMWMSVVVTNGGGRDIQISEIGLEGPGGGRLKGSETKTDIKCTSDSGQPAKVQTLLGCSGATPFAVQSANNYLVWYPLFSAVDWLRGAGDGNDQELQVFYTSPDVMDKGRTIDTGFTLTPN